jgi:hypothetical protein
MTQSAVRYLYKQLLEREQQWMTRHSSLQLPRSLPEAVGDDTPSSLEQMQEVKAAIIV